MADRMPGPSGHETSSIAEGELVSDMTVFLLKAEEIV
jgi:hypothetical protein